jgi:hypothetical protein
MPGLPGMCVTCTDSCFEFFADAGAVAGTAAVLTDGRGTAILSGPGKSALTDPETDETVTAV